MRKRSNPTVPQQWLPFVGRKLGLAKGLTRLSVDPEDIELHHVFPITTSLGRLLSDSREFEPRAGGAGIRLGDAINRAMGELLERYASLAYNGTNRIVSSQRALLSRGLMVVPFEALSLFSREQLLTPGFAHAEFTEDTPVGWFEGTDLVSGSSIYVPGQLVSLGYIPRPDEAHDLFLLHKFWMCNCHFGGGCTARRIVGMHRAGCSDDTVVCSSSSTDLGPQSCGFIESPFRLAGTGT